MQEQRLRAEIARASQNGEVPETSAYTEAVQEQALPCQYLFPHPGWIAAMARILDLSEPLRQIFHNFEPTQTLASKISEFWTYPNPCVKDFRILDLLELFAIAESETLSGAKIIAQN